MSRRFFGLVIALCVWGVPALGAVEGPGVTQFVQPARTQSPIRADGKLDEPAWQQAQVFDSFIQIFPNDKAPPSERTEVRVLYDDRNIYFGLYMHDSQPDQINRRLGRRDRPPASDFIQVGIDSAHDHRTAYIFQVTAGGVLYDGLSYQDSNFTDSWDAVWDGAAHVVSDGWTAEIAIPLQILRYPAASVQTWGFAVQRRIFRLHEDDLSVYIPVNSPAVVSRFGHLSGMTDLEPKQNVELLPYAAARAVLRPQFSDPSLPEPRLWDPSGDLGLDVRASITSDLTLNATLNPDFGQVEVDQIIQNLSTFEQFFPEKRPFFAQGMDIFQPIGADEGGLGPQMLFYSRRIGLGTPVLAAAKLTGTINRTIDVGLLDAFVAGAFATERDEAAPDRRFTFHLERPLHFGPNDELPGQPAAPINYLVGVARTKVGESSTVGARATSALPLGTPCTEEDLQRDARLQPATCHARGGNTAALEWDLRTADGQWAAIGQLTGSQVVGGPPERLLRDGIVLGRGDLGAGGFLSLGKRGGEPFRFDVAYRYASPTFDLNATGFLRSQNEQGMQATLRFVKPRGWGPLHRFDADVGALSNWTTDGRGILRGQSAYLNVRATLPGFHTFGVEAGVNRPGLDVREIAGSGVPFERNLEAYFALFGGTDANLPLSAFANVAFGFHPRPNGTVDVGYGVYVNAVYRPLDQLETRLTVYLDRTPHGPRWIEQGDEGQFFFGTLRSEYLSTTLRQQVVITPRLTLQAYAQLFTDFGLFGPFFEARSEGAPIRLSDLQPSGYSGNPSFHNAALNLNLVLRWEYRLGSTLFLVYTRSQFESPYAAGEQIPFNLSPANLFKGPATDAVLVKWSYWWSL